MLRRPKKLRDPVPATRILPRDLYRDPTVNNPKVVRSFQVDQGQLGWPCRSVNPSHMDGLEHLGYFGGSRAFSLPDTLREADHHGTLQGGFLVRG
jgi:hypothetical protein